MKVLTTEQQTELQQLIEGLAAKVTTEFTVEEAGQLAYWTVELKPKRVRRAKILPEEQNIS